MFIETTGGTERIKPYHRGIRSLTIALTDPTGSVVVNQMGEDDTDWFPYVSNGEAVTLDADNTMRTINAPCELQLVATGTGVNLYDHN